MGVFTYTDEDYSVIPTARFFKAFLDSHNLMPKLLPHEIKSIEFIKGDGGIGSIKQINFPEGKPVYNQMSNGNYQISVISYEKHEIDEVDENAFTYKYSLIEGLGISANIEKVSYDIKLERIQGGTFVKMTTTIYTHGNFELKEGELDFKLKEKELKAFKEKLLGLYKVVENYLLRNVDTYR